MTSANHTTGIVILAAGASSRLGSPKQLLLYKGKTLLKHTLDAATNADVNAVVVVLGAHATTLMNEMNAPALVVENNKWETGMASSLKKGLQALLQKHPAVDGVIIMVCDQPFISSAVLNDLIKTHRDTGKPIVMSNYGEATGPPAFFHHTFFNQLMQLKGDEGARKIVQQYKEQVATLSFSQGQIDIDNAADYEKLLG